MQDKRHRQEQILDVIGNGDVGTQDALIKALEAAGVVTTQSTLSKDLREMGIGKVPVAGGFRYAVPSNGPIRMEGAPLLHRELTDFVDEVDGAGNTLVLKTLTGHAQGVCEAIDQAAWPEVVGTLAGENTIFILCRSDDALADVRERIARLKT
jgi:transcriptional regulator of arginine metabolism